MLQPHYRPSSLIRVGPPQCPASVLSPRGFSHLCFSLGIRALVPAVPHESPDQIHAPYTPAAACPVTRFPTGSSQGIEPPLVLTTTILLSTSQRGFKFVRLSDPHLHGFSPRFCSNAHHQRLLTAAAWSGLESASGSRLRRTYLHLSCSLCTKTQSMMDLLFFVRLRRTHYGQLAGTGVHASSRL